MLPIERVYKNSRAGGSGADYVPRHAVLHINLQEFPTCGNQNTKKHDLPGRCTSSTELHRSLLSCSLPTVLPGIRNTRDKQCCNGVCNPTDSTSTSKVTVDS